MKKFNILLFSILLIAAVDISNAQNLVPNPGFENFLSCPVQLGELYRCQDWSSYGNSPDYFNSCSLDSVVGVPKNYFGFQYAATGNAYAGFINEFGAPGPPREYVGVQLIQPLITGQTYYASFKVSFSGFGCPSNRMGILMSTVPYDSSYQHVPNNNAVVYTDSVVTDTLNWYQVRGSFVADSNYTYIIIGNFFTIVNSCPALTYISYYYLDDVCLSTDSMLCYTTVGIQESKNQIELNVFPNPFTDVLNIQCKTSEKMKITFYDIASRKIVAKQFINSITLNTKQFEPGIYLYEIRNEMGIVKTGKVIRR